MGLSLEWGVALFFGVPVVLWLVGITAARRVGGVTSWLALIVGTDKRLSLSRLQAFAWTLVIFGAYVAAMAVSTKVTAAAWVTIPAPLLALAGIAIGSGVFSSLIASQTGEDRTAAMSSATLTQTASGQYQLTVSGTDLGTGVRARLGRTSIAMRPCCADPAQPAATQPAATQPAATQPAATQPAAVELCGAPLECVIGDVPVVDKSATILIVDTQNGRICNRVKITGPSVFELELGRETTCYELADLFRDDRNPQGMDLMKFQMFGWTAVALMLYVVLFLGQLSPAIAQLPTVDATVALLTGISQAGYLSGKAVSAIAPATR